MNVFLVFGCTYLSNYGVLVSGVSVNFAGNPRLIEGLACSSSDISRGT